MGSNAPPPLPLSPSPHNSGPQLFSDVDDAQPQSQKEWGTDFNRYSFSSAQCASEFGDLFKEIERAVAHRKSVGSLTESDIDLAWKPEGAVKAMIYNQKLYILESKISDPFKISRALGILHQIDRALVSSPEPLPNIEFSFIVSDLPGENYQHHTFWSLSRLAVDEKTWLMPDFGYWSWPLDLVGNYEQIRAEVKANEIDWENKVPKALWRGALKTNAVRSSLIKATRGKPWADIEEVKWKNRTDLVAESAVSALSMVDHCGHRFLIHTEGRSYSGRGKYLLNCDSITIMHKKEWIEPHHNVLVASGPDQNFVEVERNFSDLESKMENLLKNQTQAKLIAQNSVKTFRDRYLTPAAQACYWRQLIRSWAEVSFRPKPWAVVDGKRSLRGVPFETYVVQALEKKSDHCPTWKKLTLQC
ncbi:hypothetical protein P280DRAFT_471405 [Massarina eburnea CBS 473.64]|uniref:Glycosyl transferase CAP10 domain-containing protein n=1 Tax=Massarina eburnea CBS 473.64 TaxID=1395130 RepID=A0A6A6RSF2_9PLEO|nr:hypothetical protein P280DRAFT_471405 [Massarina eburnea CBS 473.64]